jgi:hypothetical protein
MWLTSRYRWLLSWSQSHRNRIKKNITINIKKDLLISPMTPPKKHTNYNSGKSYWTNSCSTYCSNMMTLSNALLWLSWGKETYVSATQTKRYLFSSVMPSQILTVERDLTFQIIWWVREWVKWHRRAVTSRFITTNHWISSYAVWTNNKINAWLCKQ